MNARNWFGIVAIYLFLFLLVMPINTQAQHWEWDWVDFSDYDVPNGSLLAQVTQCVTLDGETSPRLIIQNEDLSFQMLVDLDADPGNHAWESRSLSTVYPENVEPLWGRLLPVGSTSVRLAARLDGGDDPDTLVSVLLDVTDDEAVWELEETFPFTGHIDYRASTIGDYNGDGVLDYAVMGSDDDRSVHVYLQGESHTMISVPLDAGQSPMGIYSSDIDQDGQDELFAHRLYIDGLNNMFSFYWAVLAVTPDSVLVYEMDNFDPLFAGDINGDGVDEVFCNDGLTLLSGTLEMEDDQTHFTAERAWSPPAHLWMPLGFEPDGSLFLFLSSSAEDMINHTDENHRVRVPYQIWAVDSNNETFTPFGDPLIWRGGTASFHTIDDADTEALFLAGADRQGEYAYKFSTEAWLPPVGERHEWERVDEFGFETSNLESTDPVGVGDFDGDGLLEMISLSWATELRLYELVEGEWELDQTWPVPEDAPQIGDHMVVADLDGNSTPDILYDGGNALICVRGADATIHWEHNTLFGGMEDAPDSLPLSVDDFNDDGTLDLYFGGNRYLANQSWNAINDPSQDAAQPGTFAITSISPNPFNPSTTITLELPQAGHLRVAVFDLLGREVAVLKEGATSGEIVHLSFHSAGLASGVYFVRATYNQTVTRTRKVVLVR